MTYAFAKLHGFAYILCNPKGVIRGIGNTRTELAYSRQCRREDLVLTLAEYREKFPDAK